MRLSRAFCGVAVLIALAIASPVFAQDQVRMGVWNIEKLSTTAQRGFPELQGSQSLDPRSDADLDQIADYIRDELEVDALMVTEIEPDSPDSTPTVPQSAQLNHIAQKLGDKWRYFLGRTGGDLRLGILFNTDRIRLKKLVNLHAPEFPVSGRDVLDRDPLIAWISVVDDAGQVRNDVLLVCLHLKSVQDRFRNNRMAAVAKIIGDLTDGPTRAALQLPGKSEEREVLILGDCNDSEFDNPGFKYMFDYLSATGFPHVKPSSGGYPDTRVNGSKIDHIFATGKVIHHTMIPDSFRVHTVPDGERAAYRETFSDHFPVTVDLRIQSDDDQTFDEVLALRDATERGARLAAMADDLRSLADIPAADDEDNAPPQVEFDLIESDFERFLAPQPRPGIADNSAAPAAAAERRLSSAERPAPAAAADSARPGNEPPDPNAALWMAVELVQDEVTALLDRPGPLSASDRERLRRLIQAERELLKALRPEQP